MKLKTRTVTQWELVGLSGTYWDAVRRSGTMPFPCIVSLHDMKSKWAFEIINHKFAI